MIKFILIIILSPLACFSQTVSKDSINKIKVKKDSSITQRTQVAEFFPKEMPSYPGGFIKMQEFINTNIIRPKDHPKGKVYTAFTIDKSGQVVKPRIIQSLNSKCDKAALDVLLKLPKFTPAKNNGKTVEYEFKLPIDFN